MQSWCLWQHLLSPRKMQNYPESKSIGRTDPKKFRQSTRKKPDNWRRALSRLSWIYELEKTVGGDCLALDKEMEKLYQSDRLDYNALINYEISVA